MAKQLPSTPSVKTISSLYGSIKREELILQPEFQRKLVWNDRHKEDFIDTILNGLPFPEIYIAQSGIDFESLQTQQVVVDGQQRLSTILEYIESSTFCKKIKKFSELDQTEKAQFLNYNIVIRDLADTDSVLIKEIFKRINQTKYNLNSVEIQNALYDGEFISTAKDILSSFDHERLQIFSDSEMSRMGDLHFMLLLMATYEEGGYYPGNKATEDFIEKYNNEYPNALIIKEKFCSLISRIVELSLPSESIWYRKSNFFTMFIELLNTQSLPEDLKSRLIAFENHIIEDKEKPETEYGQYYAAMYTGTNQRVARVTRGDLFRKHVLQ